MRYRLGRIYLIPDALSRLIGEKKVDLKDLDDILEVLMYRATIIEVLKDFK